MNTFTFPYSFSNTVLRKASGFWFCAYTATAIFGGVIVWIFGHRGIGFFDQSAVFDGAWRIVQGQVIYRDFFFPFGPVTHFIQSLFFRMAGVDVSSLVLAAAVLNVVAIVSAMWLVRRLFADPIHRLTAIAGGLVTAVWFQAPMGSLWFDQTGFFFNLMALVLIVEAAFHSARAAACLRVTAGCLLVISVLSKQSIGVLLPVPLGAAFLTALPIGRKSFAALFQVMAGVVIGVGLFVVWLWSFSSLSGFWNSVVAVSGALGQSRVARVKSLTSLILLRNTLSTSFYFSASLVAVAVFAISRRTSATPKNAVTVWIVLGYLFFQNLFASITLRTTLNSLGFIGVINALAFGLLAEVFWKRKLGRDSLQYWFNAGIMLFGAAVLFCQPIRNGWIVSATRGVTQPSCQGSCYDPEARFNDRLQVGRASRVVWPEPQTPGGMCTWGSSHCGQLVSRRDFEDLNTWLENDGSNFFVFTTSTLLYGLHQRVSPQPWVYLVPDNSFRLSDIGQVDTTIVKSLKRNNVRVIVWEAPMLDGDNEQRLKGMPSLRAWLRNDFEKQKEFGPYEVWSLRTDR